MTKVSYLTIPTPSRTSIMFFLPIRAAKRKEKVTAELLLHSDQCLQYTSRGYFKLTKEYNFTPLMQNAETLITML